jgi:DNA-binding NtrC family response regulator
VSKLSERVASTTAPKENLVLSDDSRPNPTAAVPATDRGHVPAEDADAFARIIEDDLGLTEARQRVIAEFEFRYLVRALARHNGNVTRAAAGSGMARRQFYALLARHPSAREAARERMDAPRRIDL